MWHRVNKITFLLCLLFPCWALGAVQTVEQNQRWSGQVELSAPLRVALGAVLEIAPGTEVKVSSADAKLMVRGRLLILGSEAAPVLFRTPKNWQGIEFVEAEAGSRIEFARFADCRQAVSIIATSPQLRHNRFSNCEIGVQLLRESNSLLEENSFSGNQVGLRVGMQSAPEVINNSFSKHEKTGMEVFNGSRGLIADNLFVENNFGLYLQRKFAGDIRRNRFLNNQTGLYSTQSRNTPLIEQNLFQGNTVGLSAFSFSYPAVRNNRFIENQTAINNDQFGSAQVAYNLFLKNETALFNNRKSNPTVSNNLFQNNGLALFCDYSSYPQVKRNNFLANRVAAKLGIYQSADWEKRSGSKKLVRQQALARRSQNPLLEQAPTEYRDRVDLSGNWWGEKTGDLIAVGSDANLEMFFDRRDKARVSYPGYGDGSYLLDQIDYAPWLEQPVGDVGPQEVP